MASVDAERVCLEVRRHGIILARPLTQAFVLAAAGAVLVARGWPVSPAGALALVAGAAVAVLAVWRWERARLVVTSENLYVLDGIVRRRAASVRLARMSSLEVQQGPLGRLLGYGTVSAGELEIAYVARPRELCRLLR